jgi:hypothetical protein
VPERDHSAECATLPGRRILDRAPGNGEFTIPDPAFLDKIRGQDDVSFVLVVDLLDVETHRRADAEAALAAASLTARLPPPR